MTEMQRVRLAMGLTLGLLALGLVASSIALFVALNRSGDAKTQAQDARGRIGTAEEDLETARRLIETLIRRVQLSDGRVAVLRTQVAGLASPTATVGTGVAGTPTPAPTPVPAPVPTDVPPIPPVPGEGSCTQAIRAYVAGTGSPDEVLAECRRGLALKVSNTGDVHGKSRGHGKGRKA